MANILGKDFLFWAGTGTTSPVGWSKTVAFKTTPEKIDLKNRNGKSFLLGDDEWNLTVDGDVDFVTTGYTNMTGLLKMYKAKQTNINFSFGLADGQDLPQELDTASVYISGQTKITDLGITSGIDGAVGYNVTFTGVGNWTLNE
jgi:hypothetical protein